MYFGGKRDSESTLSQMCDVAAGDDQTIRLQGGGDTIRYRGISILRQHVYITLKRKEGEILEMANIFQFFGQTMPIPKLNLKPKRYNKK